MKSEPSAFSFDDLRKAKSQTTSWDGVRNYQARNTMRDSMQVGDGVLFYHSNADPPCIPGIAEVVREGYADHTAFDPKDSHYDPKSRKESPIWYVVDIKFVKAFKEPVTLPKIRATKELQKMVLVRPGSRLSVQPVTRQEWEIILRLGGIGREK
ncbi:MAG: EVE domain-containing protein [Candidatus Tectomicrobia bacterium]|uniref:EVE domain-containing protein n=1 Tax=Tectimicrobiota bacterium TaxID=2528274 RepID=A0A932GNC9_UNCTE|nr:EVE domain-containing protein [Candidatus Tectomicrobia bacterium]